MTEPIDSTTKEEKKSPSILYISLDQDIEGVLNFLRPWIILDNPEFYKIDSLDFINSERRLDRELVCIKDHDKFLKDLEDELSILELENRVEKDKFRELTYICDISNYLSSIYNSNVVDTILNYFELSEEKKEYLIKFSKCPTRKAKLDYIKESRIDFDSVSRFIPSVYTTTLQIFGSNKKKSPDAIIIPDFMNNSRIDGSSDDNGLVEKEVCKEILASFNIGDVVKGDYIREVLSKIYEKYNLNRTAKVIDLWDYFNISKVRNEYEWFYRISGIRVRS